MKRHDLVIDGIDYNKELDEALIRINRNIQFNIDIHVMISYYENRTSYLHVEPISCEATSILDKLWSSYTILNKNKMGIPRQMHGTDLGVGVDVESLNLTRDFMADRYRRFGIPIRMENPFLYPIIDYHP